MKRRAQKIRLGIFVMISSVLLLILVGFFTARRLFEKTDSYYVAYKNVSVSGLEIGSPVKYLGITVGSISEIIIDPRDVNQIIVRLSLKSGTPVKVDASADIVAMGITGLKTIEIRGGTNEADYLMEDQYIQQGTSLVEDISGRAEVIAYKVEELINNFLLLTTQENLAKIPDAIDNISLLADNANRTINLANQVISENRSDIRTAIQQTNMATGQLQQTSEQLYEATTQLNAFMQSDTISEILGNIFEISTTLRKTKLKELIENLAVTTQQTQRLIIKLESDVDKGSQNLEQNLRLLKHTLENFEEASRKINSDPSILIRGGNTRNLPDKMLD
jgi:phospholipid/cholesterol/gamma-HCH transport system substrate-binding protein